MWKQIRGYEGMYELSDKGCIRGVDRDIEYRRWGEKGLKKHYRGKELKMFPNHKGYLIASLQKEGIRKNFCVHILVAKAFIGDRPKGKQVNHKNGIKTDNRVENLEWCTASENVQHAIDTGLRIPLTGSQIKTSKLKEKEVFTIKEMIKNGERNGDIAKEFGVDKRTISDIRVGRSWKSVVL